MFSKNDIEIYTNIIGSYMPVGKTFLSKNINGTNLRNFLKSFGYTIKYVDKILDGILEDSYILTTKNITFIELWEKTVGIPDSCFEIEDDIENRRANILVKLTARKIITAKDIEKFIKILGYNSEVIPASRDSLFPFKFPIVLGTKKQIRNTIIIRLPQSIKPTSVFPLTFPIVFGDDATSIIVCIIRKIIPAHVSVIYRYEL